MCHYVCLHFVCMLQFIWQMVIVLKMLLLLHMFNIDA